MQSPIIPGQAQTLQILDLLEHAPILMLAGDKDGYGARWTLSGDQVPPAIAEFLTEAGYIEETGKTELGAHILRLTDKGRQFRTDGKRWWSQLSWLQKLKITIFG